MVRRRSRPHPQHTTLQSGATPSPLRLRRHALLGPEHRAQIAATRGRTRFGAFPRGRGETLQTESDPLPARSLTSNSQATPNHSDAMRSYAHGTSPIPLLGEPIGENLRRTTERYPDREALVVRSQNHRATYRELYDATSVLARALIASGIEQGDRVGIWSPNRLEGVVTQ